MAEEQQDVPASVHSCARLAAGHTTAQAGPNAPKVRGMNEGCAAPPTTVGRNLLIDEIGRGGMGAVFKGHDTELGRELAVKVLLEEHLERPEMVRRFLEEAQISGQLQHPGVAPVYEVGRLADQRPYFSMKLVQGHTLAELMHQRGDVQKDLGRFLGIFAQVCQALGYAHSRGVIHRDLKPANIMVGAFGEVQVMDWGLAKLLPRAGGPPEPFHESPPPPPAVVCKVRDGSSDATEAGTVLGTPAYMAPEQARGDVQRLDERCDVFGLGAILCEILTGHPPYVSSESWKLLQLAAQADLTDAFARLEGSGADPDLVALARQCLASDPEERPRDAGSVAERVTSHLSMVQERLRTAEIERAAAEARSAEALARAAAERRSRRLRIVLGMVLFGVLLTGIGGTLWWWQQKDTLEREVGLRNDARQQARRAEEAADRARDERQRAERLLYAIHLRQAQQAWEEGDIRRVRDLLDDHKPRPGEADLRGWEWYHQARVLEDGASHFQGHSADILVLTISSDGKRVATASQDSTVKLWDASTGKELQTLKHEEPAWHLAFSPDGARLVSATGDGTPPPDPADARQDGPVASVRVWDLTAGRVVHTFREPDHYTSYLAFNADGKRILWTGHAVGKHGSRCRVKVWDAGSGRELGTPVAGTVASAAFSPDGTHLATIEQANTVRLLDLVAQREERTLGGKTSPKWIAEFSSDGKRMVTVGQDEDRQVWDVATGRAICTVKVDRERIQSTWLSPDGTRLVCVDRSGDLTLRDATSGELLHTLRGHRPPETDLGFGAVTVLSFSPDRQWLASAGSDRTVKLWDVSTGRAIRTFGCRDAAHRLAFTPDGKRLLAAGEGPQVYQWEVPDSSELTAATNLGQPFLAPLEIKGFRVGVLKVAFSPDGRQVASAGMDSKIKLWDAATAQEQRVLTGHASPVLSVAFSKDGARLVSACRRQLVKVWDTSTGKELRSFNLRKDTSSVRSWTPPDQPGVVVVEGVIVDPLDVALLSAAISPDGTRVAATAVDGSVSLWDVATGRELHRFPGKGAGVDPEDGVAQRAEEGRQRDGVLAADRGLPMSLTFSPDTTRLAIVTGSRKVVIWDAAQGRHLRTLTVDRKATGTVNEESEVPQGGRMRRTLPVHSRDAWGLAFSPNGQRLAWAGPEEAIQIWDVDTGQILQTAQGHRDGVWGTTFSPDGTRLASTGGDGLVKIWDAATGQELYSLRILDWAPTLKLSLIGPNASDVVLPWTRFDFELPRYASTLAFSQDGFRLATASRDHTVRVWDARPRKP